MTVRVTSTGTCLYMYFCVCVLVYIYMHICASRVSRRAFRKHWRSVYVAQIGRGSTAIRGYIPFIITVWSTGGKREDTRSLVRSGREQSESRSSSRYEANMRVLTSRVSSQMHLQKICLILIRVAIYSRYFSLFLSFLKNYFTKKHMCI